MNNTRLTPQQRRVLAALGDDALTSTEIGRLVPGLDPWEPLLTLHSKRLVERAQNPDRVAGKGFLYRRTAAGSAAMLPAITPAMAGEGTGV